MRSTRERVIRCQVGLVRDAGGPKPFDDHLTVVLAPGVPARWLHVADVVDITDAGGGCAFDVLAALPGSRAALDLRRGAAVYVRGFAEPVRLSGPVMAGVVAALACSWPEAWGGTGAVVAAARDGAISVVACTAAGPTSTASVRLQGRTALYRRAALL